MELALQSISNDENVRSKAVQDIKGFDSQSLATQAKKGGEQLVSLMLVSKNEFDLMDDDLAELSSGNESLMNKIGLYDEKWLEKCKAKLLKFFEDEKRTNLIMSRRETQMKKQY